MLRCFRILEQEENRIQLKSLDSRKSPSNTQSSSVRLAAYLLSVKTEQIKPVIRQHFKKPRLLPQKLCAASVKERLVCTWVPGCVAEDGRTQR